MSSETEDADYYGYLSYLSTIPKDDSRREDDAKNIDIRNNASEIKLDELAIYGDFSPPTAEEDDQPPIRFLSSNPNDAISGKATSEITFVDAFGRNYDPVTSSMTQFDTNKKYMNSNKNNNSAPPLSFQSTENVYINSSGQSFNPVQVSITPISVASTLEEGSGDGGAARNSSSNSSCISGHDNGGNIIKKADNSKMDMQRLADGLAYLNKKDKQRNNSTATATATTARKNTSDSAISASSNKDMGGKETTSSNSNVSTAHLSRGESDPFEEVDLDDGYVAFKQMHMSVAAAASAAGISYGGAIATTGVDVDSSGSPPLIIDSPPSAHEEPSSSSSVSASAARTGATTAPPHNLLAVAMPVGSNAAPTERGNEEEDSCVDVTAAVQKIKDIPVNMFMNPMDNAAVDTASYLAGEAAHFVNQYAVRSTKDTLMSNYYISSFIGCVNESFYFVLDRARSTTHHYIDQLHSDDPEHVHLARIRNSSQWHYLMLRYSMASLTWKQRQAIEETRENHELTVSLFNTGHTPDCEKLMADRTKGAVIPTDNDGSKIYDDSTNISDTSSISTAKRTPIETFVESNIHTWLMNDASMGDEDAQYALARYFTAPAFAESHRCKVPTCRALFGITLFRHHCRFCGQSVCEKHSKQRRCIYRFGFTQPVRVCDACAFNIDEIHRRDQLLWRESRLRAYFNRRLIPYFNTTLDRGVDKMIRIAEGTFVVAKTSLYYSLPAQIVLETISILRRYGLSGFAGLLLRKDFMESVETLKRISGMDKSLIMSLHELTACIYYKLAIDRGLRGCNPDSELIAHAPHSFTDKPPKPAVGAAAADNSGQKKKEKHSSTSRKEVDPETQNFECKNAQDADINTAIRYAPLALKIVYENDTLDAQRLARTLGWDLIFTNVEDTPQPEQPVYMLFGTNMGGASANATKPKNSSVGPGANMSGIRSNVNNNSNHNHHHNNNGGGGEANTATNVEKKQPQVPVRTAVLAIRGTATIQDVVTDIRAAPAAFPPPVAAISAALCGVSQFSLNGSNFNRSSEDGGDVGGASHSMNNSSGKGDDTPEPVLTDTVEYFSPGDQQQQQQQKQQQLEQQQQQQDSREGATSNAVSSSSNDAIKGDKVKAAATVVPLGSGPKEWEWLVVSKNKNKKPSNSTKKKKHRKTSQMSGPASVSAGGDSSSSESAGNGISVNNQGSSYIADHEEDEEEEEEEEEDDEEEEEDWYDDGMPKCSYACVGMIRSAMYILREVGPSLLQLHREGYAIKICGHSMGGCVSALLSYMLLRAELPSLDEISSGRRNPFFSGQLIPSVLTRQLSNGSSFAYDPHSRNFEEEVDISQGLNGIPSQAIAYSSPSCVDADMADLLGKRCGVINIILHDDVLCRITPASIRNLKKDLSLFQKEVFHHMRQDFYDVLGRAASLWSPRQRQTHPNWFPSNPSVATEKVVTASISGSSMKRCDSPPGSSPPIAATATPRTARNIGRKFPVIQVLNGGSESGGEGEGEGGGKDDEEMDDGVLVEEEIMPELWLPGKIIHLYFNRGQYHAAEVSRTFPDIRRIEVQGDIFNDHLSLNVFNALLEVRAVRQTQSAAKTKAAEMAMAAAAAEIAAARSVGGSSVSALAKPAYPPPPVPNLPPPSTSFGGVSTKPPLVPPALPTASTVKICNYVSEFDRATNITNGKAANTNTTQNMLSSTSSVHSMTGSHAAIPSSSGRSSTSSKPSPATANVNEIADAPEGSQPPAWEPFDFRDECHCCGNSFTWHSTFQGDAQEYRERYNCRHCGKLVCGPCSTERRPIPKWGMIFPKRVCDTCINAGDFAFM